jgi:hypothetical protein
MAVTLFPWSRVLLEKQKVAQLVNKFPVFFIEPGGPLSCSEQSATGPYPEPDESNPHPSTLFFDD